MWKLKQQNVISLPSSEAELYALVDVAKEVKFIYNVLMTMGIKVKLPIIIRVDNMGAIFMTDNVSVSQRTKHVDLRTKFINQYVDNGSIKIKFVKMADNLSNSFTKNVSGETYKKFAQQFVLVKDYWKECLNPDKSRKGVRGTLAGLQIADIESEITDNEEIVELHTVPKFWLLCLSKLQQSPQS
jgi:hypothetical protein